MFLVDDMLAVIASKQLRAALAFTEMSDVIMASLFCLLPIASIATTTTYYCTTRLLLDR